MDEDEMEGYPTSDALGDVSWVAYRDVVGDESDEVEGMGALSGMVIAPGRTFPDGVRDWEMELNGVITVTQTVLGGAGPGMGGVGDVTTVVDTIRPWVIVDMAKLSPRMRVALDQRERVGRERDARICVCGHPVGRHIDGETCSPTRMTCWCREARPVIEAGDVRAFLRKTRGLKTHALTAGIVALEVKGRTWSWVVGQPTCARCKKRREGALPVLVDETTGELVETVADDTVTTHLRDIMICKTCCTAEWPDAAALLWDDRYEDEWFAGEGKDR